MDTKIPMVPPDQVQSFEKEMAASGVDWQLTTYGTAYHAFYESSCE